MHVSHNYACLLKIWEHTCDWIYSLNRTHTHTPHVCFVIVISNEIHLIEMHQICIWLNSYSSYNGNLHPWSKIQVIAKHVLLFFVFSLDSFSSPENPRSKILFPCHHVKLNMKPGHNSLWSQWYLYLLHDLQQSTSYSVPWS